MAQTVLITLTTAGADTGPFNLYSDVDGYVTPFETGVSKSSLTSGYVSSSVPNAATVIRVKSNSVFCTNYIDLYLITTTTTTSSSSSTSSTTSTSTSTTSTTTTQDIISVILYARHDPAASTFPSLKFAYSTDGGTSWTAVGAAFTNTVCSQRGIINVPRNSSLSVRITQDGNVNNVWQSARSAASPCPAFSGVACSWPALTSQNTKTYYFTVNGDNQGTC